MFLQREVVSQSEYMHVYCWWASPNTNSNTAGRHSDMGLVLFRNCMRCLVLVAGGATHVPSFNRLCTKTLECFEHVVVTSSVD